MNKECSKDVQTGIASAYWDRVNFIANLQRTKGLYHYGTTLEANPADIKMRLRMLEEELVDALMYIEWINDWLEGMNEK